MSEHKSVYRAAVCPVGGVERGQERKAFPQCSGCSPYACGWPECQGGCSKCGTLPNEPCHHQPSPDPSRAQEPQQESEGVGVKGWVLFDGKGKRIMALPCEHEHTAWDSVGALLSNTPEDEALHIARVQGAGYVLRPVYIYPAPPDGTDPVAARDATIARLQSDYNEATALLEQARERMVWHWEHGDCTDADRTLIAAIDKYLGTDSEGEGVGNA